jgi:hypothetical protein
MNVISGDSDQRTPDKDNIADSGRLGSPNNNFEFLRRAIKAGLHRTNAPKKVVSQFGFGKFSTGLGKSPIVQLAPP